MVSIDQSDPQKIEDGIYGIGGFLNVTFAARGGGWRAKLHWFVGSKHFWFLALLGETIQFDEHIFQMG